MNEEGEAFVRASPSSSYRRPFSIERLIMSSPRVGVPGDDRAQCSIYSGGYGPPHPLRRSGTACWKRGRSRSAGRVYRDHETTSSEDCDQNVEQDPEQIRKDED